MPCHMNPLHVYVGGVVSSRAWAQVDWGANNIKYIDPTSPILGS